VSTTGSVTYQMLMSQGKNWLQYFLALGSLIVSFPLFLLFLWWGWGAVSLFMYLMIGSVSYAVFAIFAVMIGRNKNDSLS